MARHVILGIDGGGSSVVARAVQGDGILYEGRGGPANLAATAQETLLRHINQSLDGSPPPDVVGACFAGYSSVEGRALVRSHLSHRFPRAEIRVAPDYVAAVLSTASSAEVCCIAGTGSLCGSLVEGHVRTSGGGGYLLGDRGSAALYGREAIALAVSLGPGRYPPGLTDALFHAYGTTDIAEIARLIYGSPSPAALLGRLAPYVAAHAKGHECWASDIIDGEIAALADVTVRHINDWGP